VKDVPVSESVWDGQKNQSSTFLGGVVLLENFPEKYNRRSLCGSAGPEKRFESPVAAVKRT
jgi:hypothetical protein